MKTNKRARNIPRQRPELKNAAQPLVNHVKQTVGKNQSKTKLDQWISSLQGKEREIHLRYLGAGMLCMDEHDFEKHKPLWNYLLTEHPEELRISVLLTPAPPEKIEIDEACYIRMLTIAYHKKAFGKQNLHQVIDKLGQVIHTRHSPRYVYWKMREIIREEEERAKDKK